MILTTTRLARPISLEMINILTKQGLLNENAGPYQGLKVIDGRKKVVEDLKALNLLIKEDPSFILSGTAPGLGLLLSPFCLNNGS
jgi:valyl-tRNA synthetase